MKRATAILWYQEGKDKDGFTYYCMMNLSVVTRDNHLVTLVQYGAEDIKTPVMYKYYSFHNMYDDALSIIRVNGFYLSSYENFGRRWYDMQFISDTEPYEIKRYSHSWR